MVTLRPEFYILYPRRPDLVARVWKRLRGLDTFDPDYQVVEVIIRPHEESTSARQRRAFHGPIVQTIADESGEDREKTKRDLLLQFAGTKELITVDGEVVDVPKGWSDLTKGEASTVITKSIALAAEMFGVEIVLENDDAEYWRE